MFIVRINSFRWFFTHTRIEMVYFDSTPLTYASWVHRGFGLRVGLRLPQVGRLPALAETALSVFSPEEQTF